MPESIITPSRIEEDKEIEVGLRPRSLDEFVGQSKIKEQLRIFIQAAKERQEALDHLLLYGPPGLGKTTLSHIIAHEMGVNITSTSGPVIERPIDLSAVLSHLQKGDVFFIDEVHRLSPVVEEILYPAMEEYKIDIMIGKGPSARSIKLELPPYTLVGATTRAGLLTSPLRARFGMIIRIGYYTSEEMYKIVQRSSSIMGIEIDEKGAKEIAARSRGTPRIANRLLRRIRDYAQVKGKGVITREMAVKALELLEVDELGLDEMDKAILTTLVEKFNGGPVGIKSLSVAVGEEADTLESVYEPYLIQQGFIKRTPGGRVATPRAYEYLGIQEGSQQKLWKDGE